MTERSASGQPASGRWAWADVDLAAVRHNIEVIRSVASPAVVWAVVKADGYGHGANEVALAALDAGAAGLCVALVDEGVALRRHGVGAPILVLSEQPPDQLRSMIEHDLISTVYSAAQIDALCAAGARHHRVHLKVDTGMHRVGCDPADALSLAARIESSAGVELAGLCTHLAVADEPGDPFTASQLDRFDTVLDGLVAAGIDPGMVHTANSAGALAHPAARRMMVRIGIAAYGVAPGPGVAGLAAALRPAMSLRARVSFVRRVVRGERVSYGLRHTFDRDSTIATVPIGYADGVPRRLFETGGEVLIGGRRRRIAGVVTMDQTMIDMGDDQVDIGDDVVLIGRQGDAEITATDWAERLGTIGYEVVCGIGTRIERRY